jgi:hypothetical protein
MLTAVDHLQLPISEPTSTLTSTVRRESLRIAAPSSKRRCSWKRSVASNLQAIRVDCTQSCGCTVTVWMLHRGRQTLAAVAATPRQQSRKIQHASFRTSLLSPWYGSAAVSLCVAASASACVILYVKCLFPQSAEGVRDLQRFGRIIALDGTFPVCAGHTLYLVGAAFWCHKTVQYDASRITVLYCTCGRCLCCCTSRSLCICRSL